MDPQLRTRREAERWFLDHGLPSVVTQRARLRAVWPRSAPALAGYAVISACLFVIILLTGQSEVDVVNPLTPDEGVALVILALAVPAAVLVGWIVARFITDRSQAIVSTVAIAVVALLWPIESVLNTTSLSEDVIDALLPTAVILLVLLATASGIGSVLGWALRLTFSQLVLAANMLIRALPVVLLTALMFFNTYIWLMVAAISESRLWSALAFLVVLATAFVVSGALEEAKPILERSTASRRQDERLAGTPFEKMLGPPMVDALTPAERFNVVFILAASQLAQIMAVAAVTAGIFFVLGVIVVSPAVLAEWTRGTESPNTEIFGITLPVSEALIRMTLFLGALTFMYVSAKSVGDGEYRKKFLDPLIEDVKLTLVARN